MAELSDFRLGIYAYGHTVPSVKSSHVAYIFFRHIILQVRDTTAKGVLRGPGGDCRYNAGSGGWLAAG